MNIKSAVSSVGSLVLGVFALAIIVSLILGYSVGSSIRKPDTTIVVQRPDSYRGWWGYYGAGLPGWGGPKFPPPPFPHPKPGPPPPAPPPPAPAPPPPAPAPPPPAPAQPAP